MALLGQLRQVGGAPGEQLPDRVAGGAAAADQALVLELEVLCYRPLPMFIFYLTFCLSVCPPIVKKLSDFCYCGDVTCNS